MPRKSVTSSKIAPPIGPFSMAVAANGLLFVSGQVGLDPSTRKLVEGGVTEQTRQILSNVEAVLTATGKDLSDVVKANVFLAAMSDFEDMNAEYARHFESPFPARTTIQVAGLPLGALVEIEFIAQ